MNAQIAAAVAVLLSPTGVLAQDCVPLSNAGFEQDGVSAGGYVNGLVSGWTSPTGQDNGRIKLIAQGSGAWGGLRSGSGANYLGLQRAGTAAIHSITLEQGERYRVSFLLAERPGFSDREAATVRIGEQVLFDGYHPMPRFARHTAEFTAEQVDTTIVLSNSGADGVDQTIFFDDVSICKLDPTCAAVANPGFEANVNEGEVVNNAYVRFAEVDGWAQTGRIHILYQDVREWGGLNSGDGNQYLALQSAASLEQSIAGLVPGRGYTLSFIAAERSQGGAITHNERITASVVTAGGGGTGVSEVFNPYANFREHSVSFVAGSTNMIRFVTEIDADVTVFLDAVRVCETPTTTARPVTVTRTVTATTNTAVARNFDDVRAQLTSIISAQRDLQTVVAAMSTQQRLQDETQSTLVARVGSISDAIAAAVGALPAAGNSVGGGGVGAAPTIEAFGNQIRVEARSIEFQSECGVINPCTLLEALNAFRGA